MPKIKKKMETMKIDQSKLPDSFTNKIISNNSKEILIRSNLNTIEDINSWVDAFGEKS